MRQSSSAATIYVTSDCDLVAAAEAEKFPHLNPEQVDADLLLRDFRGNQSAP
ncbi:MAG: hypothetical protein HY675_28945 [Chloroflexi bacterium]|nr:hypothetical protein [Chloroflexota bacterium]